MKILNIVGARPNFMKVAPLQRAFEQDGRFESLIVHTGQHYDEKMSAIFFRQLELPAPQIHLGVGGGSHAEQTGRIMVAFEKCLSEQRPDLVVVVGDVNSTVACSLVAAKVQVPVAHVEAGLRSHDRTMPEEINRLVTDRLSDLFFVTEPSGVANLRTEGVSESKIHFVGNLMIDSLVRFREKAAQLTVLRDLRLSPKDYFLVTMHRPANVDRREGLVELLCTLEGLTDQRTVLFPIHPRTLNRVKEFGLESMLIGLKNLVLLEPQGYLEFLQLMEGAAAVITDSGGVQEETTFLNVPCLTLRENTERPITIEMGTNQLMSLDAKRVITRTREILDGSFPHGRTPPFWDGRAAGRIIEVLHMWHKEQMSTRAQATLLHAA